MQHFLVDKIQGTTFNSIKSNIKTSNYVPISKIQSVFHNLYNPILNPELHQIQCETSKCVSKSIKLKEKQIL